jgi:hypothetical protein
MKQTGAKEDLTAVEESQRFPLRRLYLLLIPILTLLSLLGLSIQTDNIMYAPWKLSAEIRVSSITLTLLLLAWLPLLVPWIISVSPRLQKLFTGLRGFGIEEIEIGTLGSSSARV